MTAAIQGFHPGSNGLSPRQIDACKRAAVVRKLAHILVATLEAYVRPPAPHRCLPGCSFSLLVPALLSVLWTAPLRPALLCSALLRLAGCAPARRLRARWQHAHVQLGAERPLHLARQSPPLCCRVQRRALPCPALPHERSASNWLAAAAHGSAFAGVPGGSERGIYAGCMCTFSWALSRVGALVQHLLQQAA